MKGVNPWENEPPAPDLMIVARLQLIIIGCGDNIHKIFYVNVNYAVPELVRIHGIEWGPELIMRNDACDVDFGFVGESETVKANHKSSDKKFLDLLELIETYMELSWNFRKFQFWENE